MIADELTPTPFDIVDDPEGLRQVVGLRLRPGVRAPGRALLDLHRRLRHMAGDYGVRSVDLPFAAADLHPWEEHFGARVRPGRPVGLLRLPTGVLSAPPGRVPRSALAWRVRVSLTERLGGPDATLTAVARLLAMHPRTLQRALSEEGLTFGEILDCVRRERARALLTATDMPFTQVSTRLGFAEPAVFTRCARRWWGRTPSQLRASGLPAVSGPPGVADPRADAHAVPGAHGIADTRGDAHAVSGAHDGADPRADAHAVSGALARARGDADARADAHGVSGVLTGAR